MGQWAHSEARSLSSAYFIFNFKAKVVRIFSGCLVQSCYNCEQMKKAKIYIIVPLVLISIYIFLLIAVTGYSEWYKAPERLEYGKDTTEYRMVEMSLSLAAHMGTETPPLNSTFRRVIELRKSTDKNRCKEKSAIYTEEMKKLDAVIEEKYFFGLGKTHYRLASCAGIHDL